MSRSQKLQKLAEAKAQLAVANGRRAENKARCAENKARSAENKARRAEVASISAILNKVEQKLKTLKPPPSPVAGQTAPPAAPTRPSSPTTATNQSGGESKKVTQPPKTLLSLEAGQPIAHAPTRPSSPTTATNQSGGEYRNQPGGESKKDTHSLDQSPKTLLITITTPKKDGSQGMSPLETSQTWDSKKLWDTMSLEQRKLHVQHVEKANEINRQVQDWAKQKKIIEDTTRRMHKAQNDDDKIRLENAIRTAIEQQKIAAGQIDQLYGELIDLGDKFGLTDVMNRTLANVRLLAQSNNNNIVKYAAEAELNNARHAELVKRIQNHKYFRRIREKSLEAMRGFTGVLKSSPEVFDLVLPEIAEALGVVDVAILHTLQTKVLNHVWSAMSAALNFIPYAGGVMSGLNNAKVNADDAQVDIMLTGLDNAQDWLVHATGALLASRLIGSVFYFKSIVMDGDLSFFWHAISLCVAQLSTHLFYSTFGRSLSGYTECLIIGVPLCQTLIQWGCLGAMDCAFEKLGQCVYDDNFTGDIKVDVKKVEAIQKTFKSLNDHRGFLKIGIQDANHIEFDKNGSALVLKNDLVLHLKDIDSKNTTSSEDRVLKTVTLKSLSGQIVTQDAQEFYESGGFLKIFKRAAKDTQITPLQMAPSWRQWLSAKLSTPMSPKSYKWIGLGVAFRASLNYGRMLWNWSQDFIAVVVEGDDFIDVGGNTCIDLSTIRNSIRQQRMYEKDTAGIVNGFKHAVGYSEPPPMYKNTGDIVGSAEQALEAVAEAFASDKYNSVGVFQYPVVVRNVLTHMEGTLNDSSIVQAFSFFNVSLPVVSNKAGFVRNFSKTVGSWVTWLGPSAKTVFVDQAHIEALKKYLIAMYDGEAPVPNQQLKDSLNSIIKKAGATAADVSAAATEYFSSCENTCSEDVVNKMRNEAIRLLVPEQKQQAFEHVSSMCQIIHEEAPQFSQKKMQDLMQTCIDWMSMPGLDELSPEQKSSGLFGTSYYTYRELAQECYNVANGYVNLLRGNNTCSDMKSKLTLMEQCRSENKPITFTTDRYYASNFNVGEIYTMETESIAQKLSAMYDKISLAFVSFASYVNQLGVGEEVVALYKAFKDMLDNEIGYLTTLVRQAFKLLGTFILWHSQYDAKDPETDKKQDNFEKKVANTTEVCNRVEEFLKSQGKLPTTPWYNRTDDDATEDTTGQPLAPWLDASRGFGEPTLGWVLRENQRPMRVDYTSATTNLLRVKYKIEEREEEEEK